MRKEFLAVRCPDCSEMHAIAEIAAGGDCRSAVTGSHVEVNCTTCETLSMVPRLIAFRTYLDEHPDAEAPKPGEPLREQNVNPELVTA